MNKIIIITGANGFIGRYLVEYFHNKDYRVIALIHAAYKAALSGVEYRQFDMDSFAGDIIPKEADAVIHTAYIPYKKDNNSDLRNLKGTQRLLEIARKKKVKKFVYLSSFSAMDSAISHYGKNKFEIENIFDKNNDLVLRPGLVIGNGGLYNNIKQLIKTSSIIPLIGGGNQPLQTININLLAEIIEGGIENNTAGFYNIAEGKAFPMKDFYRQIAKENNRRIKFVPLPYSMATLLIKTMELFLKQPPITMENLNGLKQMKEREVADLEVFK